MSKPVVLRPRADRDVDEICAFLRDKSPEVAKQVLDAIEHIQRLLGDYPGIGSTRHAGICPETPDPLRFHPLTNFPRILVYYLDRPHAVEMVRVWDAARGLSELRVEEPRASYLALGEGDAVRQKLDALGIKKADIEYAIRRARSPSP